MTTPAQVESPVEQVAEADAAEATDAVASETARPEIPPPAPSLSMPATPIALPGPSHHDARSWNALLGWSVSAALFTFVIAFYVLAYMPLRSELIELEQATASQLRERDVELAALRSKLAANQHREAPAAEAAAATPAPTPAPAAAAPAAPQRARREPAEAAPAAKEASTAKAATPKPAAAKPAVAPKEPKEPKEPKAVVEAKRTRETPEATEADAKAKGVDRAAAAAATAALEAEMYGDSPEPTESKPAEPAPSEDKAAPTPSEAKASAAEKPEPPAAEEPSAAEKKEPLGDIERESSDDPLEGL